MKQKLSDQYVRHRQRFNDLHDKGNLISLYEVYEDYGRPKYNSPRRRFRARLLRNLTGYILKKNNFEIEKVIMYSGKDIYVCQDLAIAYLNELDVRNYLIVNSYLLELGSLKDLLDAFQKEED